MKLTPGMFDFEKYDYFRFMRMPDPEAESLNEDGWSRGGYGYGVFRKLKEPTYYRLLSVGEVTQKGDEHYYSDTNWTPCSPNLTVTETNVPIRRKLPRGTKV